LGGREVVLSVIGLSSTGSRWPVTALSVLAGTRPPLIEALEQGPRSSPDTRSPISFPARDASANMRVELDPVLATPVLVIE
jgi:hypothetical protein